MNRYSALLLPLSLVVTAAPIAAHAEEEHKLTASDALAGDQLGFSVAIHGDTIAAGAPGSDTTAAEAGAGYVYVFDGEEFVEEAKLLASDGAAGDAFGFTIAVGHDLVVVGAPRADASGVDSGAVYVFVHSGGVWTQEAKLVASNGAAGDAFGTSVAVHHDTVIVGSVRGGTMAGSAYVFERVGTTWTEEAELFAADGTLGNQFGKSVSLAEDFAAVGAILQDGVASRTGAVYTFRRSAGVWSQEQKIQAADGDTGDFFGAAVSLFGDVVLEIGASGDDDMGTNAGAAYRFARRDGALTGVSKRVGLSAGDFLGSSVSVAYNYTLTGSRQLDVFGISNAGGAVMWGGANTLLLQVFVASDAADNARLGSAVAAEACWMVAGAPTSDELGADAGGVYVFVPIHGGTTLVNGSGVNPEILHTEHGPNIGFQWHLEIDATAFPTVDMTQLHVYRSFLTTPRVRPYGEVLVDLSTQRIMTSTEFGSGIITHHFDIPNDPFLIGIQGAVQGVLFDSTAGTAEAMTNGELATIGCGAGSGHH